MSTVQDNKFVKPTPSYFYLKPKEHSQFTRQPWNNTKSWQRGDVRENQSSET